MGLAALRLGWTAVSWTAVSIPVLLGGALIATRRRAVRRDLLFDDRRVKAARVAGVFHYELDPRTGALHIDPQLGAALGYSAISSRGPNGSAFWSYVDPADVVALREFWTVRRRHPQAAPHLDFRAIASDGSVRWFRARTARMSNRPAVAGRSAPSMFGTVTDISELKRAEARTDERSQELAHIARTAMVGELAAALAHEIRQPLTAILINSQTAVRVLDARPGDPDAVREILQQLAADGQRAAEVVQRIRAFARKAEVQRGPVDLNAVIHDAVQLVRHDTIRRRVDIRFALAPEPLVVVGDHVQLQQVVLNLVLNALDAIAENPEGAERCVAIETARSTRSTATVTVRDTGPGIAAERQAAIFEPFVTTKRTGLGMGLAICRIILEVHGGRIQCESNPPTPGAAFVVTLPLGANRSR